MNDMEKVFDLMTTKEINKILSENEGVSIKHIERIKVDVFAVVFSTLDHEITSELSGISNAISYLDPEAY